MRGRSPPQRRLSKPPFLLTPLRYFSILRGLRPNAATTTCNVGELRSRRTRVERGGRGEGSRVLPKFPFCSKYTHDRAPLSLAYVDSVSCGRFTGHFVVCTPTPTAIDRSRSTTLICFMVWMRWPMRFECVAKRPKGEMKRATRSVYFICKFLNISVWYNKFLLKK